MHDFGLNLTLTSKDSPFCQEKGSKTIVSISLDLQCLSVGFLILMLELYVEPLQNQPFDFSWMLVADVLKFTAGPQLEVGSFWFTCLEPHLPCMCHLPVPNVIRETSMIIVNKGEGTPIK